MIPVPVDAVSFSWAAHPLHDETSNSCLGVTVCACEIQACQHGIQTELRCSFDDPVVSSPLSTVGVAVLNCGRNCREDSSQLAVIDYISEAVRLLGIIFK